LVATGVEDRRCVGAEGGRLRARRGSACESEEKGKTKKRDMSDREVRVTTARIKNGERYPLLSPTHERKKGPLTCCRKEKKREA